MKKFLLQCIRHFFPRFGATYGYAMCGRVKQGAYCLNGDGKEGIIYYYSYLKTGHISKRHYQESSCKGILNYNTHDLSPSGERYIITLEEGDRWAKEKFLYIEKQYKQKKQNPRKDFL